MDVDAGGLGPAHAAVAQMQPEAQSEIELLHRLRIAVAQSAAGGAFRNVATVRERSSRPARCHDRHGE